MLFLKYRLFPPSVHQIDAAGKKHESQKYPQPCVFIPRSGTNHSQYCHGGAPASVKIGGPNLKFILTAGKMGKFNDMFTLGQLSPFAVIV